MRTEAETKDDDCEGGRYMGGKKWEYWAEFF